MDLMTRRRAMMAAAAAEGGQLLWERGTFVLDADTNSRAPMAIPHGLGVAPDLLIIWTEDYSPDNLPEAGLMGGCFLAPDLFNGLPQRLSSSASAPWAGYCPANIYANGQVNMSVASSTTYFPSGQLPTDSVFYLPFHGASTYWRAGVTYKYFIAKGWR